uniref:Uncharacterized protein n=1 Tax=Meloidogyne javanica TaxID=6303 RepID=A0A915MPS2_MELJA
MEKRQHTNDIYEKTMVRHVESMCEMIHVKCLGSTTKRAPHGQEAHRNEIFDYHDALHSADMIRPMEDFNKYNNELDLTKDKKAIANGQLRQLRDRLIVTKMKNEELNEFSLKFSSGVMVFKIDEEIKNYQEATKEVKHVQEELQDLEKKLDVNRAHLTQVRKTKHDLEASLKDIESELAQHSRLINLIVNIEMDSHQSGVKNVLKDWPEKYRDIYARVLHGVSSEYPGVAWSRYEEFTYLIPSDFRFDTHNGLSPGHNVRFLVKVDPVGDKDFTVKAYMNTTKNDSHLPTDSRV